MSHKLLVTAYKLILALIGLLMPLTLFAVTTQWENVNQGLDYTILQPTSIGKIYAFRMDPKYYQLDLVLAKDYAHNSSYVQQMAQQNNAILAVNGGFFTPDYQPLGLRIKDSAILNPLKPISWWGVFYLKNHQPYIVAMDQFHHSSNISFAVQAGPRLLTNGTVTANLRPGLDNRTALCITPSKQIILIATDDLPISTTDLANIIKSPEQQGGLNCYSALNLDGGRSTQLYANIGNLKLNIVNFSSVAEAIIVVPRKA